MKQFLPFLLFLALPALTNAQAVRRVMVESFTNASCPPCAAQNPAFNTLLQNNVGRVVLLKYQTDFPGYDPMNQQNPSEVGARDAYYAVTSVPNVRLDGVQNAGVASNVTQSMLNNRISQSTPIEMELDHQVSEDLDSVYIYCKVKNLDSVEFNPGGVVLHTAVIEKRILFPTAPGSTNERDFKSVMRKMLPNASGAALAAIPAGDSVIITYAVALPSYIYNFSQIGVVAFVQKVSNRQVYQAIESLPKPLLGNFVDVGVSPNGVGPDGLCEYSLTPRVTIKNDGNSDITTMDVSYTLNGGAPVTEPWTGTLAPGQTTLITFPEINVTPGVAAIDYGVTNANGGALDYNSLNEVITSETYYTLSDVAIGTDIAQDMEAAPVRGTPANTVVIKDAEDHFMVVNRSVFGVTQQIGGYGASTKSLFSNFYDWNDAGAEAHVVFEKIDLTGSTNNYLKFDYAHAQYQTSNDRMRISISTNCGATWTTLWNKAGAQLATAPATNSRFRPTATQWRTDSIALTAFNGLNDVNVRFTAATGYGNDLFVDNIRVYPLATTSADEPGRLSGKVQVYPNPASNLARIDLDLEASTPVNISVFDLSGKLVETITNGNQLGAGTHQFNWAPKAQGVFLVRVATAFGVVTERIAVVK